jgi:hypothetical protein
MITFDPGRSWPILADPGSWENALFSVPLAGLGTFGQSRQTRQINIKVER